MRHRTLWTGLLAMTLGFTSAARAEIRTQDIEYRDGPDVLRGFLAYDDATDAKRPAVLVAPEWWGLDNYPKHRAEQLARMGYVAFAIDMYGKDKVTDDPKEANALHAPMAKDRMLMRRRAEAGLDVLMHQKDVDPSKVAAIGYCFGGTVALELARAGEPLRGVVAFHGDLSRTEAEGPDKITGKVLVCHGAADPMVPLNVVNTFIEEMKQANADYQVNLYSKAEHAFTNPAADTHHIAGIGYNAEADARSWAAMNDFFAEIFK